MKIFRFSTLLFAVLCIIVLTVESVFALPVFSLTLFMMQQPLFSDQERVVIAIICGGVLSVLYQLPLAVGMIVLCCLAMIYQTGWWKSRAQVRDVAVVTIACVLLYVVKTWKVPGVFDTGRFLFYSLCVVGAIRLWLRRRAHFSLK